MIFSLVSHNELLSSDEQQSCRNNEKGKETRKLSTEFGFFVLKIP